MKIVELIQGSPEWLADRAKYRNASDAPAMMTVSPLKTRDQLLAETYYGIGKDVTYFQQKIYDNGHTFEALARPYAEEIVGEPLYPVVGREGKYGASFDGITMDEKIIFEHKTLNDGLREFFASGSDGNMLPALYTVQMEHQLMVSGAEKCLFVASSWTNNQELLEIQHCWYYPNLELRRQIDAGWELFEKDLSVYEPPVVAEKVEAQVVESLPLPSVVVKGEITTSNLDKIKPLFDKYLSGIKTELKTDQDFADADANAKNCRTTAKNIEALRENIISQMADVNAIDKSLASYQEAFNKMGLSLEKAVDQQKQLIKSNAILAAKNAFNAHIASLEEETKPIRLNVPVPDFAGAIKSIRSITSMNSRINDALANGKLQADEQARDIRAKLSWMRENTEGYKMLFSDIMIIINKPMDDLQLLVKSRISEHKAAEEEKAKKLQEEAAAAERLKIAQETSHQMQKEQSQPAPLEALPELQQDETVNSLEVPLVQANQVESGTSFGVSSFGGGSGGARNSGKALRPARFDIVRKVAAAYNVTNTQAEQWLIEEFQIAKAA